jgi:hypothetical protein
MLVCARSLAGILSSKPAGGMDVCLLRVVCCQVEIFATGWSLIQRSNCVWSRNLKSDDKAIGLRCHRKQGKANSVFPCMQLVILFESMTVVFRNFFWTWFAFQGFEFSIFIFIYQDSLTNARNFLCVRLTQDLKVKAKLWQGVRRDLDCTIESYWYFSRCAYYIFLSNLILFYVSHIWSWICMELKRTSLIFLINNISHNIRVLCLYSTKSRRRNLQL